MLLLGIKVTEHKVQPFILKVKDSLKGTKYIYVLSEGQQLKAGSTFKNSPSIFCCTCSATGKRAKQYPGSLHIVTSHDCFSAGLHNKIQSQMIFFVSFLERSSSMSHILIFM
ncbi:hypothetical protein KIL84_006628 [Mauremys mutica]|uniref:Uncharacterized protein n=1 Tax=Mauremys mutica TaxID=74926 RepID=A0A9D3X1K3_9SAUR|nr:hypothetical protein KIL84_006628 [Mauremys mutica]